MKLNIAISKPGHPPIVIDVQRMRDEVVALLASVTGNEVATTIALNIAESLGLDPRGKFDDPDDDPDEFVAQRTAELSGMRQEWESRCSRK